MNNACQTKGQSKCDTVARCTTQHLDTFALKHLVMIKVGMNEKEGGIFFLLAIRLVVQIFFIC